MGIVADSGGALAMMRDEFKQAVNRLFGLSDDDEIPLHVPTQQELIERQAKIDELQTGLLNDAKTSGAPHVTLPSNLPPVTLLDTIGKRVDRNVPHKVNVVDITGMKDNPAIAEKARRGMSIFKAANGRYMYIAQYSNNLRDNDWFPEIIAGESHKRFVQLVEEGKAPLPELWLGHQPDYKVGESFAVAVDEVVLDEETGDSVVFALAFGFFDEGTELIAEAILAADEEVLAMSHGMPYDTISYWAWDMSVITQHETREVSVLDRDIAANRVTGFFTLNGSENEGKSKMAVDEFIRDRLVNELGVPSAALDALEARNAQIAEGAKALHIERKSKGLAAKTEVTEAETATVEAVEGTPSADEVDPLDQPLTRGELVEVITDVLAPILEQFNAQGAKMQQLEATQKAIQQQQQEQAIGQLAPVTLQAMIAENMKRRTAVGAIETRVDGRETLAKSAPREAKEEDANLLSGMF